MGFEILEEFQPITPMGTISVTWFSNRKDIELSDLDKPKGERLSCLNDGEECGTPRTANDVLRSVPLVCPPAPRKVRAPASRKLSRPSSQGFFEVPDDLTSVFIFLSSPSKKIRTS